MYNGVTCTKHGKYASVSAVKPVPKVITTLQLLYLSTSWYPVLTITKRYGSNHYLMLLITHQAYHSNKLDFARY